MKIVLGGRAWGGERAQVRLGPGSWSFRVFIFHFTSSAVLHFTLTLNLHFNSTSFVKLMISSFEGSLTLTCFNSSLPTSPTIKSQPVQHFQGGKTDSCCCTTCTTRQTQPTICHDQDVTLSWLGLPVDHVPASLVLLISQ